MSSRRTRTLGANPGFFTSAIVAATAISVVVPARAGERFYVEGYGIQGLGATAASSINATLTGLGTTKSEVLVIPAGIALQGPNIERVYNKPLAGAIGSAITLSVPSFGAGNTKALACVWGYYDTL